MSLRHLERPADGPPAGALVFFHGYYGIPEDFLAFLDKIDPARRLHGFLPEGPHEISDGRTQWYRGDDRDLSPVREWAAALPYPRELTVFGGWSQGTSVAYTIGLDEPPAAGIVALGGWLPDEVRPAPGRPLPPVFIGHGTHDEGVGVDNAHEARDVLAAAGADVTYYESPVGHEIGPHVIPHLRTFVERLPA